MVPASRVWWPIRSDGGERDPNRGRDTQAVGGRALPCKCSSVTVSPASHSGELDSHEAGVHRPTGSQPKRRQLRYEPALFDGIICRYLKNFPYFHFLHFMCSGRNIDNLVVRNFHCGLPLHKSIMTSSSWMSAVVHGCRQAMPFPEKDERSTLHVLPSLPSDFGGILALQERKQWKRSEVGQQKWGVML